MITSRAAFLTASSGTTEESLIRQHVWGATDFQDKRGWEPLLQCGIHWDFACETNPFLLSLRPSAALVENTHLGTDDVKMQKLHIRWRMKKGLGRAKYDPRRQFLSFILKLGLYVRTYCTQRRPPLHSTGQQWRETLVRFTCESCFITTSSWLYYDVHSVPFNFWPHALFCYVQMHIWQQRYILASTPRLATSQAYEAMYRQIPAGLWFPVGMWYYIISQNKQTSACEINTSPMRAMKAHGERRYSYTHS